jgi:tetratricopeptide (TPR) repeat protein
MTAAKNTYWANQSEIQRLAVAGWIARAENKNDEALDLMRKAADREDATEKHPVTPGALAPAREMLAELLLEVGQPAKALAEYEASQKIDPNRFHGLAGAARAAEAAGDRTKAKTYYDQLIALAKNADTERPEIVKARAFGK